MKIVLAIDESKYSQAALESVIAHVRREGAEVRVLHVVEPIHAYISAAMIPHYVPYVAEIEEDRKREARELVGRAAEDLRRAGFAASGAIEVGDRGWLSWLDWPQSVSAGQRFGSSNSSCSLFR